MKPKHLARRIVFASLAIVLTAVTIVANVLLDKYSLILHRFVAGDSATVGKDASDALENSDNVVRTAAEESMVLLENKDDYLPLRGLTKVNLFGYGSTDAGFLLTGGGSGGTSITDEKAVKIDLTDAFKDAGIEYNKNLISAYEAFSTFDADWRSGGSTGAKATESLLNPDADFYSASRMDEAYAYSHVAVVTLSRWGCENGGDKELVDIGKYLNGTFLELTAEEKAMLDALENKNFEVIVLLNTCNNMELGFVKDYSSIKACIYVGIPGQSGASAIPKKIGRAHV